MIKRLTVLLFACQSPVLNEYKAQSRTQAVGSPATVMVYLKDQAPLARGTKTQVYRTLVDHAERSQKRVIAAIGKTKYRAFHIMNVIRVEDASAELRETLAAMPEVDRIEVDRAVRMTLPQVDSEDRGVAVPGVVATGADQVWERFSNTGQGVVVAGQDSGVEWTHPALKAQYRGWDGTTADHRYSWHDAVHGSGNNPCGYDTTAPCDDHGHGTHTMGTMVGDDGDNNRIGMAPGAKWIACRNMDDGVGRASTYIECFEWFLAPYPQGGNPRTDGDPAMAPDVINNSWGCPASEGCTGQEILPAIEAVRAAGIVVVASAGNEGPSCGTIGDQPATSTLTISVGAYDHRNGRIASFSSRGPSALDGSIGPTIAAPGVSIKSSVPGGGYSALMWSGTSMAGPHVAGAVALILSAKPGMTVDEVTQKLIESARPTAGETCGGVEGSAIPNNTFGHGTLNVLKAVEQIVE